MNYIKDPITTTCINDSHFPNEIKIQNRPQKGKQYTIIATAHMIFTNELGLKLAEIDTHCPEYPYYKASRFAINQNDIHKLSEIQIIDIQELITESIEAPFEK